MLYQLFSFFILISSIVSFANGQITDCKAEQARDHLMTDLLAELKEHSNKRFANHEVIQLIHNMGDSKLLRQRAMVYWQVVAWMFGDMNNVVLKYDNPDTEGKRILNKHMGEDGTHCRLFQRDWKALGLDNNNITPDQTLDFFFSDLLKSSRKVMYNTIAIDGKLDGENNEFVRYVLFESIEIGGEILFNSLNKYGQVDQFYNRTGIELVYFGNYHTPLENGGLIINNTKPGQEIEEDLGTEEDVFKTYKMTKDEYNTWLQAAKDVVDDFADNMWSPWARFIEKDWATQLFYTNFATE